MPLLRRLATSARPHVPAGLVLLVCLAATAAMAVQVRETTTAKDAIRFRINTDRVANDINRRVATYVAMLRAGAGLLAAVPDLDAARFRSFVDRMDLETRYPGIQGIGYTERVRPEELTSFVAAHRVSDPGFRVWPEDPRAEYHAIVFLEPLDRRNRAAIGYDMFTEPVRRAAMERARDTGLPAASGRVTLVQEIDLQKQAGFLIYMPVYHGTEMPPTVEERRARLRGFVYSPFRAGDFLNGIFGTEQLPRVGFEVYDGGVQPARLLLRSAGFDRAARFKDRLTIDVAGRTWTVPVTGTPALEDASSRVLVPFVVFAGVGVSLLLAGLTAAQTAARRRLEASESALWDTSQRFQQLADTIPQLVWMARADGWIYWYNRRFYEYTGATHEQLEGWGWQHLQDPALLPDVMERWKQALAAGHPFEIEFPLRSAAGEMRWFLTRVVPIRNARGLVTQWFGTNTDVQSRRDTEQRLEAVVERERALRAEAERVSRIKDEFLATLSHELRTPLNAIIGWVHLLLDGSLSGDAQRRALATVHRNAGQQARLIDDLLDMNRIISGKIRLDTREVDLKEIVEAAVNVVRPATLAKTIGIECDLAPATPSVLGDPGRLQQVMWNLLHNAVKFTPEGGRVRVSLSQVDGEVRVVVSDTGVGLDPAFIPYVFDRFRQADGSSTREHGGLGLGLAIVKSLVELHGGNVRATSEGIGRGATFVTAFPAVRDRSAPARLALEPFSRVPAAELSGVRVLLVEDDPDARDLARVVLERAGAVVRPVGSAGEALLELSDMAHPIDLLVTDLAMPGMDGFDLVRHLREAERERRTRTPAVALSAYARAADRVRAAEAGFDAYVSKPFQPADLVSTCAAQVPPAPANRASVPSDW